MPEASASEFFEKSEVTKTLLRSALIAMEPPKVQPVLRETRREAVEAQWAHIRRELADA